MLKACKTLLLIAAVAALSGCALPFYWRAIGGQIDLLRKRTPIDALLEDPLVDPALKSTLGTVAKIREFAVDDLRLPDNASYTSYVALERSYVVWNVVATDEFSVDPQRWCFPFAGCVAYRGFFDRADAERFQAELAERGSDTYSGGASAYSTLGYFDDPVLSTMLGGGEQYIASLLFHELAHQKLYVKDDSEFSEAFATVIEEFGTERWLATYAATEVLDAYHRRLRNRADFAELIAAQQTRLRAVFATADPPDLKRHAKARAYDALRVDYAALKEQWGGSTDYDAWFAQPLNNATIAAVATYRRLVAPLRARLDDVGLEAFYAQTAELAKLSVEERARRVQGWKADGPSASTSVLSQPR
jgi:predicted aminopeptidase